MAKTTKPFTYKGTASVKQYQKTVHTKNGGSKNVMVRGYLKKVTRKAK